MGNHDGEGEQLSTQMKIISQCFVKPKYETESSKKPYFLGPCDLLLLPLTEIQKGLLFSTKPNNIQSDLLDTLEESISISLVHFHPFAGQFVTQESPDDEDEKWVVYVDCTKGPGARLIHASVDVTVSNILSSVDVHPIVPYLFAQSGEKSINYDGRNNTTRPLLSVQVTELIDGVFIGFTMNHAIVDGSSQWHFINSLSEIFLQLRIPSNNNNNNVNISRKPVFGPYFPNGSGPVLKLASGTINKVILESTIEYRERIFHFSSESLRKLKARANEECGVVDMGTISSFQALAGFMWRSITRARSLGPELETGCGLTMNARSRFSPPVSNDYFGNLVMRQYTTCNVGEVLGKGLGWAAMLVHQLVVSQGDKPTREFYDGLVKSLGEGGPSFLPCPNNPVVIGGSARFDMYGSEFGLGKAEAVLIGCCNKGDGKLIASPGREGGGSIDLEVCLEPKTMKRLELDEEFMSFVTQVSY